MTEAATADTVLATLRVHRKELRAAGLLHLSLFGSVARGEAEPDSDIDLLGEIDPERHLGLFGLVALERRLAELLGREVDLLPASIENPLLRSNITRDCRLAF